MISDSLHLIANQNIQDILNLSIKSHESKNIVVIFDTVHPLAQVLLGAYKIALPKAKYIEFNDDIKEQLLEEFDNLEPNDLVVMIQSSNFRINDFRIRLNLFDRGVKVIEHMHLYRNSEDQWETYIRSLEYDQQWYQQSSRFVVDSISNCDSITFDSLDKKLIVSGPVETPKLNIGDFTGMKNVGGTYPIGEVFTEVINFDDMNGCVYVYGYANRNFDVTFVEPFWVRIEQGLIVEIDPTSPQEFIDILEHVKTYETPLIREIGFGLNRAITKDKPLGDITAFERTIGLHLSLGHKHSVYKKPGIQTHKARFHIDLFIVIDKIESNTNVIFNQSKYQF
jgi:aminopeptidase